MTAKTKTNTDKPKRKQANYRPAADDELTDTQARFISEYLVDLNGKQAAIRAGCSPRSAAQTASRMLTYDNVIKALNTAREVIKKTLAIKAEDIAEELRKLASSNMADYYTLDKDGKPEFKLKGLTRDQTAAIQELMIDAQGSIKLKLYNKESANVSLAKVLGYIIERSEVKNTGHTTVEHRWILEGVEPARKEPEKAVAH